VEKKYKGNICTYFEKIGHYGNGNFNVNIFVIKINSNGHAIAQAVSAGFPPRWLGFKSGSSHVGFVVEKLGAGAGFLLVLQFPCQSSSHQFLHNHPHLSSGTGTIGQ
jgi:hypothetical protein